LQRSKTCGIITTLLKGETMSKVYIPSIPRRGKRNPDGSLFIDPDTNRPVFETFIDFSPAAVYGELVEEPIFEHKGVLFASNRESTAAAERALMNYYPDHDSIIAVGDPVAIALCTAVATRLHGGFSILRWDGKAGQYVKLSFRI
jgi:hypothetical protein